MSGRVKSVVPVSSSDLPEPTFNAAGEDLLQNSWHVVTASTLHGGTSAVVDENGRVVEFEQVIGVGGSDPSLDELTLVQCQSLASDMWDEDFCAFFAESKVGTTITKAEYDTYVARRRQPAMSLAQAKEEWTPEVEVWQVPVVHMLAAIHHANGMGKTALLLDSNKTHPVDSFFSYRQAITVEAKKLAMERFNGTLTSELREGLRAKLVQAMTLGYPLIICMTNSATNFTGDRGFCGAETFPEEVFTTEPWEGCTLHPSAATVNSKVKVNTAEWHSKLVRSGPEVPIVVLLATRGTIERACIAEVPLSVHV
jgi:hypothetical protein